MPRILRTHRYESEAEKKSEELSRKPVDTNLEAAVLRGSTVPVLHVCEVRKRELVCPAETGDIDYLQTTQPAFLCRGSLTSSQCMKKVLEHVRLYSGDLVIIAELQASNMSLRRAYHCV